MKNTPILFTLATAMVALVSVATQAQRPCDAAEHCERANAS